jgi:glycine dehydrogenase subunit 2
VVLSAALAPYAPAPWVTLGLDGYGLAEHGEGAAAASFGRLCAFHGQMGMYVRALSYMLSHGADGLRQVAEDAVLNANYIKARLGGVLSAPFDGPCMHEALFDDLDFAKAMIDEGFHPMTMYFPLVVHGAMLIEPTETESRAEIDRFCDAVLALAGAAKAGEAERFKAAPVMAPLRRLDETLAARKPRLRWRPPEPELAAAE